MARAAPLLFESALALVEQATETLWEVWELYREVLEGRPRLSLRTPPTGRAPPLRRPRRRELASSLTRHTRGVPWRASAARLPAPRRPEGDRGLLPQRAAVQLGKPRGTAAPLQRLTHATTAERMALAMASAIKNLETCFDKADSFAKIQQLMNWLRRQTDTQCILGPLVVLEERVRGITLSAASSPVRLPAAVAQLPLASS